MMVGGIKRFFTSIAAPFTRTALSAPVNLDTPIEAAVHDAEVLLAFGAQSRRGLKKELIETLSKAREAVLLALAANKPVTAAERTAFWFAYDELAVAMAPLSAHSIRCSMRLNARRFPTSLVTPTALLAAVAVAVFVASLIIQSFWVAGKELLDKADALDTQRIELTRQVARNRAALRREEQRLERLSETMCELGGPCPVLFDDDENKKVPKKTVDPSKQEELGKLRARRDLLIEDIEEKSLALKTQSTDLDDLNVRGRPLQELLQQWHKRAVVLCSQESFFRFLCPVDAGDAESQLKALREELAIEEAKLRTMSSATTLSTREPWPNPKSLERRRQQSVIEGIRGGIAGHEANMQRRAAHEVRIILSNLATYVVPLVMGLLGALTFILQALTTQLYEHTYVPVSASGSVVRLCLGAIAGVFGGLLAPGSDALLKGLPPLFIPFVFGYGIEILFALLNRVVKSFTQGDSSSSRSP